MSRPVVLRKDASADAETARDYFDTVRLDLGQDFMQAMTESIEQIRTMPEMYGMIWDTVRAAPMKRFGYVIYYRL